MRNWVAWPLSPTLSEIYNPHNYSAGGSGRLRADIVVADPCLALPCFVIEKPRPRSPKEHTRAQDQ